jgi:uncharacterized OB-fold protein
MLKYRSKFVPKYKRILVAEYNKVLLDYADAVEKNKKLVRDLDDIREYVWRCPKCKHLSPKGHNCLDCGSKP